MNKFLCKLGIHTYDKWQFPFERKTEEITVVGKYVIEKKDTLQAFQQRKCIYCGYVEERKV